MLYIRPFNIIALCLLTTAALQAEDNSAHQFSVKGVKIHFIVEGKGEPVVLIHGLHSSAYMNWKVNGIIDALAK
jgi:hypothetical protein